MKFGIVGPVSKDIVVFPNGKITRKFGAVAYTVSALAKLLEGTDSEIICLSHIDAEDYNDVVKLLRHPNVSFPAVCGSYKGTEIELHYFDEQERISRQNFIMSPISAGESRFIADCDHVLFMPLNDTDISLSFMREFRKYSKATVVFDVHGMITGVDENGNRYKKNWDNSAAWLKYIDILKMNDKEVVWASGEMNKEHSDDKSHLNYAVSTVSQGLTACWITFGDQSSLVVWRRGNRILWANVPVAHISPVVDTIGCGDTASAGFIHLYSKLHSPLMAVMLGNMLGSVKATVYEPSEFPTGPEVRGMISQHYRDYLHSLLDEFLLQTQLIVHEVKEENHHEGVMYGANGDRHGNGTDNAGGSHSQGSATPWS